MVCPVDKQLEKARIFMTKEFLGKVIDKIDETEKNGLLNDRRADGLSGLSGLKTVGLLQRLVHLFSDDSSACYLEIGVYQGLTLVSTALESASVPVYGIDNFATLDPEEKNLSIVRQRMEKFDVKNAHLINMDFEAAMESLGDHIGDKKLGVYFIDGPHDYRSQLICLTLAKRFLHDNAVIVIDDANYPDVRRSTRDFLLGHPEFKMVFEAYSPDHPANLERDELAKWEAGWLNGVNVLVRDPDNVLPDMLPPVDEDRTLYFNEWLVNRLRLAELAPEALVLADAITRKDTAAEQDAREAMLERYGLNKPEFEKRLRNRNVYSKGLPVAKMNTPR